MRHFIRRWSSVLVLLVCVLVPIQAQNTPEFPFTREALFAPWVDSLMRVLTPQQKVAQLFMVAVYPRRDSAHFNQVERWVTRYGFGGAIFFQGGPKGVARLTNRFQAGSRVPMLMAIDGEWGLGMRLDSVIMYPRQMMLGAISDPALIDSMGRQIALDCRRIGLHVNFAPCVDINNNPLNPVINNRSFGEDKYLVTELARRYMQGMAQERVLASAKHFPGHGDTHTDSHVALPLLEHSLERLDTLELYPYKELIREGITGVMAGHLFIPALDTSRNRASSVSPLVLKGLLRDKLGFNGLIYTDALNMAGVAAFYPPGELEVQALKAGVDVLLMPDNPELSLQKIMAALDSGVLSWDEVEMSCRRVLSAKKWAGLDHYAPVPLEGIDAYLNRSGADLVRRKIIEQGVTVVQNQNDLLPLKNLGHTRVAFVLQNVPSPNDFLRTLQLYQENDVYYVPSSVDSVTADSLVRVLSAYDVVVTGIHDTNYRPAQQYGITPEMAYFSDQLASATRTVLCLFGIPYGLNYFRDLTTYAAILVCYQDQPVIQQYAAQIVYGAVGARGRLSVAPALDFVLSDGLDTRGGLRLKYGPPAEVGADEAILARVDQRVLEAIGQGVMPGCQILAARNGVVFYHKAFGQDVYGPEGRAVSLSDMYDLASLTKILATTPVVMWLSDRGEIQLRDRLSRYLSELRHTDKQSLTFTEVMTHQAGLPAYLDFVPDVTSRGLLGKTPDGYPLKVADSLFASKEVPGLIRDRIAHAALLPDKTYKYSDLGFYLLKDLVQQVTDTSLEVLTAQRFYRRMGASSLGYHPLNRFSPERLMPTERDTVFRKQWIRGYVHDPGAALLGGVGGHAGLFSTANDAAKMMQMFLNGGVYGGERFLQQQTVEEFTAAPFARSGNRRGIGFDRPQNPPQPNGPTATGVSQRSFGHSGFTGTYVWADPVTGVQYVFLSNRVSPDASNNKLSASNLRTDVHQLLLESLGLGSQPPAFLAL